MRTTISTKEFAQVTGVKPYTVLRNHCLNGHHCGIKPIKLANRLLRWDLAEVEKLLNPKSKAAEQ